MSARRDVVEVITVGAPFAVFKLAVGAHLLQASAPTPTLLGWPLVALGVTDLALNAGNGLALAIRGRRLGPICVLHGVVARLRGPGAAFAELGLALDAGLAFVLVAAMIAAGQIALLPSSWLAAWNVAVILNVLGAGALRLTDAVRRASAAAHGAPEPRS
ncbi:MAG: hypothetical protein FJ137_22575 [Deltaproteobacteria bacterium]|nr:hypothetical protein [Deltaproteobacteria bacterium]